MVLSRAQGRLNAAPGPFDGATGSRASSRQVNDGPPELRANSMTDCLIAVGFILTMLSAILYSEVRCADVRCAEIRNAQKPVRRGTALDGSERT